VRTIVLLDTQAILLLYSVVFSAILLLSDFRMRIIVSLERVVSYNSLHSFLHVQVFNYSEFVMEVYKWKGVNF
jgi:hypothetical protein